MIASAVDACAATSTAAVAAGADLLIVHHGVFWGATAPLVGPLFEAIAPLVRRPCALYAAHLPLDGHPEFGNNALLADRLGIPRAKRRPFGDYGGRSLGLLAELPEAIDAGEAARRLGMPVDIAGAGDCEARTIAIVSGAGGSLIDEAVASGAEVLLTGEVKHHDRVAARDRGLSLWLGGHYATETLGVRALVDRLADEFGLDAVHLDLPTGG